MLRVYPRRNQKTAIQFLDYLLAKLFAEVIQTDNGAEFASSSTTTSWTGASDTSTQTHPL